MAVIIPWCRLEAVAGSRWVIRISASGGRGPTPSGQLSGRFVDDVGKRWSARVIEPGGTKAFYLLCTPKGLCTILQTTRTWPQVEGALLKQRRQHVQFAIVYLISFVTNVFRQNGLNSVATPPSAHYPFYTRETVLMLHNTVHIRGSKIQVADDNIIIPPHPTTLWALVTISLCYIPLDRYRDRSR